MKSIVNIGFPNKDGRAGSIYVPCKNIMLLIIKMAIIRVYSNGFFTIKVCKSDVKGSSDAARGRPLPRIIFIIASCRLDPAAAERFHLLLLHFTRCLLRRLLQILLLVGFNEWLLMTRVYLRADFSL